MDEKHKAAFDLWEHPLKPKGLYCVSLLVLAIAILYVRGTWAESPAILTRPSGFR